MALCQGGQVFSSPPLCRAYTIQHLRHFWNSHPRVHVCGCEAGHDGPHACSWCERHWAWPPQVLSEPNSVSTSVRVPALGRSLGLTLSAEELGQLVGEPTDVVRAQLRQGVYPSATRVLGRWTIPTLDVLNGLGLAYEPDDPEPLSG